jgi:hypothetical protein
MGSERLLLYAAFFWSGKCLETAHVHDDAACIHALACLLSYIELFHRRVVQPASASASNVIIKRRSMQAVHLVRYYDTTSIDRFGHSNLQMSVLCTIPYVSSVTGLYVGTVVCMHQGIIK